jgi:hypothetical protein
MFGNQEMVGTEVPVSIWSAGTRAAAPFPAPLSPLAALFLRCAPDRFLLTKPNTSTGLQAVLTLKNLHELRFACVSTAVGIEGSKLGEVSTLSVTEKWLEQLKSLTDLERLKLQGCGRIDDEAVAVLIAMPSLREVDLKGTAVTEKGVSMLRAAKPRAVVYSGPWEGKAAAYRNN